MGRLSGLQLTVCPPAPKPKVKNARHSKATNRWGTEPAYITMARAALGGRIELDPMSEPFFNRVVRAERFYTKQDNCFAHAWVAETVLLNPAGGLVPQAWRKLIAEYTAGNVQRAVWIGFSVEQLCLLADDDPHPTDFSWLLTRKRISFLRHDGYAGAPGHNNYVVGLGIAHEAFMAAFAGRGKFRRGALAVDEDQER